ncbi:hydrogenase maturation protease [Nocardia veterana]|uniref:Hydrogenase maturation protease n=1 Tax=Nocardia veterana TaxID=132249 RepID=A0A7X6M373_9NOCA|nr:hydrogenase maturation protease [Nocardia veterana]NKY88510.1 hydrogenase maturation protease [Nocardia veterana]
MTGRRAVVIGVGNEYRRDDAVGPVVVHRLERLGIPDVSVAVCDGEPTGLLDLWAGADLAVVVDAVLCEPSTPGRIWRTTIEALRGRTYAASSHALGIPDAVPLGRILGRVPAELVVVAVEAEVVDLGVGLSDPVAAAVPEVLAAVLTELARVGIASAHTRPTSPDSGNGHSCKRPSHQEPGPSPHE